MQIMITGANGFIGRNLRETLACRRPEDTLSLIDVQTPPEALRRAAKEADFVFHLAGVNRPQTPGEFMEGNRDFTLELLKLLEAGKRPPVVLSSSTQAALDNPYGASKRAAEDAVFAYGLRTGAPVYVYRLTNAFGKWSRPNYNSAVATFCHNIARDLPITVNDPAATLRLVYIDDIVKEFLRALEGMPTRAESAQPCRQLAKANLMLGAGEAVRYVPKLFAPGRFFPRAGGAYGCARLLCGAFAPGRPWAGKRERSQAAYCKGRALAPYQARKVCGG